MKESSTQSYVRTGGFLGVMILAISAMVWGMNLEGLRWVSAALAVCVLTLNIRMWNLEAQVEKLKANAESIREPGPSTAAS